MRYELKRLNRLGTQFPYHPNHNVRHLAVTDAVLSCDGKQVLVLGCGRGLVEYLLPDGMTCVSIDADKGEIETAMEINRYKRNRNFHVGDIYDCDQILGQARFPTVVISEVIEHLPDDRQALKNAHRHLLPGGSLVLTVPNIDRCHNRLLTLRWHGHFSRLKTICESTPTQVSGGFSPSPASRSGSGGASGSTFPDRMWSSDMSPPTVSCARGWRRLLPGLLHISC